MSNSDIRRVPMPATAKHPNGHNLPLKDRVLVVVGANGSGKTRFGVWLDSRDADRHHRVSAHRSLVFPDRVQPMDLIEAEERLFSGQTNRNNRAHFRQHNRWQNRPATALLDDFEPLVTLMVSESFAVSDQYRVAMRAENKYVSPPKTKLDMVKLIWESVLPARELVVTGNRIETRNRRDASSYHAKEMSDGERGIFHLIGEVLSVPKDGVFIVDEPELHLHRAIQACLWDAVEAARPWLREYTNDSWDWEEVPETDSFPESMLLEVMGSRQPILFIEGDRGSLDYFLYGRLYHGRCVVPCGSCEVVIHSTRSFAAMADLHHNTCFGLVDNDGRAATDVEMLESFGVKVLPVALVENLLLVEPVLQLAAAKLGRNPEQTIADVKSRILDVVKKNSARVVSNLTRQEMEIKLRLIGKGDDGAEALTTAFTSACAAINPAGIYKRWEIEIARVIDDKDYEAALRYYKIKGLASEAGSIFGLKYPDQIMRWLRSENAQEFIEALRTAAPKL